MGPKRKTKRRLEMGEEAWEAHQRARRVRKVVEHRRKLKWRLVEYAGGKCQKCGYKKKIPGAYAFHHKDPDEKDLGLAKNYGKSIETLRREVDKCDLLCVRCHAEVHHKLEEAKS